MRDTARLDAELLLSHVLQCDRVHLFMDLDKPLHAAEINAYREAVAERGRGCPVAYVCGTKEFYSLEFALSSDVLIPRPDTEHLVDQARKLSGGSCTSIIDLGTGSGILAVCLAKYLNPARVVAVDSSEAALRIAKNNAARLVPGTIVEFLLSDWWSAVEGQFAMVVSNPPYITAEEMETLDRGVAAYEPHTALLGGADGLECYRNIFNGLDAHLLPGGLVLLEISDTVAEGVVSLARASGLTDIAVTEDFSGHQRVLSARKVF